MEEIITLSNHPLISEEDVEEVVEGLISAINRVVDGSTPWARSSVYTKL